MNFGTTCSKDFLKYDVQGPPSEIMLLIGLYKAPLGNYNETLPTSQVNYLPYNISHLTFIVDGAILFLRPLLSYSRK